MLDTRRRELKAFLRARRSLVRPEDVGIATGSRRLVPGLRREEVAQIAGVGLTWYTWLEQGRDIHVSVTALRQIARALRLSETDEAYLLQLAGHAAASPSAGPVSEAAVTALDCFQCPAAILDTGFNTVAMNAFARWFYSDDNAVGPFEDNHLWQVFMNPLRRRLYRDYDEVVEHFVRLFRMSSADRIGDPDFVALVDALCAESPLFARLWGQHRTDPPMPKRVQVTHPDLGHLVVDSVRLPIPGAGGAFMLLIVPADRATKRTFSNAAARDQW